MGDVQHWISTARPGSIPYKAEGKYTALGSELYLEVTILYHATYKLPKAHGLSEQAEGFTSQPPSVLHA